MLWTAPELMVSQRAGVVGLSTGTQKGDVYSFAIILHEILYRAGLFRCVKDDEPVPPKSKEIKINASNQNILLNMYLSTGGHPVAVAVLGFSFGGGALGWRHFHLGGHN